MCARLLGLLSRPSGRGEPESSLSNGRFTGEETSVPGLAGTGEGVPLARSTVQPPGALPSQHQQQVLQAVERAKQVTMGELNSIVGVSCAVKAFPAQGFRPRGAVMEEVRVFSGSISPGLVPSGERVCHCVLGAVDGLWDPPWCPLP